MQPTPLQLLRALLEGIPSPTPRSRNLNLPAHTPKLRISIDRFKAPVAIYVHIDAILAVQNP